MAKNVTRFGGPSTIHIHKAFGRKTLSAPRLLVCQKKNGNMAHHTLTHSVTHTKTAKWAKLVAPTENGKKRNGERVKLICLWALLNWCSLIWNASRAVCVRERKRMSAKWKAVKATLQYACVETNQRAHNNAQTDPKPVPEQRTNKRAPSATQKWESKMKWYTV